MSAPSNIVSCSPHANFYGYMGITAAAALANAGSAYGTAKAGLAMACTGVMRPDLVMKAIIPIVMAGILGIYGLILGIIVTQKMTDSSEYTFAEGYAHFSAGITCGLSALAAGLCIGVVGDAGIRGVAQQPKLFVVLILILIFAEALALFGLIVALSVSLVKIDNGCTPWAHYK